MANSHITEHTFTTNTWSEFKTYLLHKYVTNKHATFISIQKQLDNVSSNGESIHVLYNKISELVNLLQILDPTKITNTEEIIYSKLVAAIPSNYYFRLSTPLPDNLMQLVTELEKIQSLEKSISNKRYDAANVYKIEGESQKDNNSPQKFIQIKHT